MIEISREGLLAPDNRPGWLWLSAGPLTNGSASFIMEQKIVTKEDEEERRKKKREYHLRAKAKARERKAIKETPKGAAAPNWMHF